MRSYPARTLLALLLCATAPLLMGIEGCSPPPDELVVLRIQFDSTMPSAVNGISVTTSGVEGGGGTAGFIASALGPGEDWDASRCGGQRAWPWVIVAEPDAVVRVVVDAESISNNGATRRVVATQTIEFSTQEDRWLDLPVCLSLDCDDVTCEDGMTCREGSCSPVVVDTSLMEDVPESEREGLVE